MPIIPCNTISMYYEVHGEGTPIMVIWGIGGEISSFIHALIAHVNASFQVIYFDNRGSGRSEKPDIPYSIEMMADDTAALMDGIGINRAHILGISTGSRIALSLVDRHPEKVLSLVLHVAASRSPGSDEPEAQATYDRLYQAMIQPGFMEKMLIHPPSIDSFKRQFKALVDFDGRSILHSIRVPVLIVNGSHDPSTPVSLAMELHDGICGSELLLVEGDHMIARNHPDLLIEPLFFFLKTKFSP